jgi:hypothetical protein
MSLNRCRSRSLNASACSVPATLLRSFCFRAASRCSTSSGVYFDFRVRFTGGITLVPSSIVVLLDQVGRIARIYCYLTVQCIVVCRRCRCVAWRYHVFVIAMWRSGSADLIFLRRPASLRAKFLACRFEFAVLTTHILYVTVWEF